MGDDLLEPATRRLYEAFASYPRPSAFLACGCCFAGRVVAAEGWDGTARAIVEVAGPGGGCTLGEVRPEELVAIAEDVPLTGGNTEVFKHYLPRLAEVTVSPNAPPSWPDPEILFGHLNWVDGPRWTPWTDWPPSERNAVSEFLLAYWTSVLHQPVIDDGVDTSSDTALCAVGQVSDVGPCLTIWESFAEATYAAHLHHFLDANEDTLKHGALSNAFWSGDPPRPQNRAAVIDWLRSDHLTEAAGRADQQLQRRLADFM